METQTELDPAGSAARSASSPGLAPTAPAWLEILLCAALALLLLYQGIIPAWRRLNTDFPNYYLVARLLHEGFALDRIYDWVWLQRVKDHWGLDQSLVGFAGLTPFSALPIVPLSVFSAMTAKRIWTVLNLLFLAASVEAMHRTTALGRRRIWLIALLAILPLRTSFLFGQLHLLVLFFLAFAFYFASRNRDALCGGCIALAAALKIYPLFFVLYFLWKGRHRAAFAIIGACAAIILVSYVWMGPSVLHLYAAQVLPSSLQGEVIDPYNIHFSSTAALLHRLFLFEPRLNPAPVLYSPSLYAVLYPFWQLGVLLPLFALFRKSPAEPDREKLEWAAFLFALLLLSPVPSSYHFVVMILSVVLLVDVLLRRGEPRLALTAIALYLLISVIDLVPTPDGLSFAATTLLAFKRLWLELLLFAVFLTSLRRNRTPHAIPLVRDRRMLVLFTGSVAIIVFSIAGYHRHFAYIQQNVARDVQPPAPAYLAIDPHPVPGGYLFTAMTSMGFRILHQPAAPGNAQPYSLPDQLSFAVAPDRSILLELADGTGSRIVHVSAADLASQSPAIQRAPTLILDAESPAISADSTRIAFIREQKGRGTLWLAHFDGASITPPTQAADATYNVYSASFLGNGNLLFTARTAAMSNRLALFVAIPGQSPHRVSAPDEEIASATASPGETLIAFTRLERSHWRLGTLNTLTHRETLLTAGDCNAYTPAWSSPHTIVYASDCGRGFAMPTLATIELAP